MKILNNNDIIKEINFIEKDFYTLIHHNDNYEDGEYIEEDCIYFYLEEENPEGF